MRLRSGGRKVVSDNQNREVERIAGELQASIRRARVPRSSGRSPAPRSLGVNLHLTARSRSSSPCCVPLTIWPARHSPPIAGFLAASLSSSKISRASWWSSFWPGKAHSMARRCALSPISNSGWIHWRRNSDASRSGWMLLKPGLALGRNQRCRNGRGRRMDRNQPAALGQINLMSASTLWKRRLPKTSAERAAMTSVVQFSLCANVLVMLDASRDPTHPPPYKECRKMVCGAQRSGVLMRGLGFALSLYV